jgi:putative transposase
MPWQETAPMTERVPCIAAYVSQLYSRTKLCERFGIRRTTGDQWVRRYAHEGPVGRQEKSRAPPRCPHRIAKAGEVALLEATRAHPTWGPRTILPSLLPRRPALELPAPSTAGELFRAAGVSQARARRRRHRPPGTLPRPAEVPQAVWTADFKGQFRTGDGLYGSPVTGADAYRRFLRNCAARRSPTQVEARPRFERLFDDEGLPEALRPDNGPPFATPACCRLSPFSVWWITRGSRQQRIAPGRPEQHGAHERRHRTRNAEATQPPEPHQEAQQARCHHVCRE